MANQIDRFLQIKGQSSCCRVPCPTQEDSKQQTFQSTVTHDSFKPPNSDKVLPFCSSETTICQWRKFDILRMPGSEMQVSSLTIPYHWSCVSCTYRMKSGNCLNIHIFWLPWFFVSTTYMGPFPDRECPRHISVRQIRRLAHHSQDGLWNHEALDVSKSSTNSPTNLPRKKN